MDTDTCARLRARWRGYAALITVTAAAGGAAVATAATAQAASALTANAKHDVLIGQRVTVRGNDGSGQAGQQLAVEVRHGRGWTVVAHTTAGPGGRYRASWVPGRLGRYSLRTVA